MALSVLVFELSRYHIIVVGEFHVIFIATGATIRPVNIVLRVYVPSR